MQRLVDSDGGYQQAHLDDYALSSDFRYLLAVAAVASILLGRKPPAMQLDRYELSAGRNLATFEFVSEGRRGRVLKVIQFELMEAENVFNLAFGDVSATSNQLDDETVTDNGDTEKVLATVVAAVYAFADLHPAAWVYATGSTAARTRLYRMGINKYLETVEADFDILGQHDSEWEPYEFGKDYQAFAVRRKIPYI